MNCSICGQSEMHLNVNTGRREAVKHPRDVKAIICSSCMQRLLSTGQGELNAAYHKAMKVGELGKARALGNFIREGKNAGETPKPERDPLRRKTLRMARVGS